MELIPDISLNPSLRELSPSATLAINERSNKLLRQGQKIFKLGFGQSPFPVPPPVVEALQTNAHQKDYLPVKGLAELREAVANYFRRWQGIECTGDDVLIGPGSKALMFILQLVYDAELALPIPSWVSYAPQAHILGRPTHWLPAHLENGWRLVPDALERFCRQDQNRPWLLVLNYPNNPSGASYQPEALEALAQVARRYRLVVLSDEIYGELHHTGQHVSMARFYPEGTIVSSGLSKWCGAGGWRLGTFVFPRALRGLLEAMAVVASETYTSTSTPIQYAAVRAFQGGEEIEQYLQQARRILQALGNHVAQQLREAGVAVSEPEGGFYLFPDFSAMRESLQTRGITTSPQLCQRLLEETGVALLPGSAFGCQPEILAARLAYVDFDGASALAGAEEILFSKALDKNFLNAYCGEIVTAIERLCEWIHGNEITQLVMLSWLEQKPRQKNERQKNGAWHHAKEIDGRPQTFFCPPSFCLLNVFAR
ncbi:aminotransferase class I/II-fold pyridoxal phosphate-dependent enzyme [candidate division KSB1 bacterium]|nr:aminotransferase class I/II-fold pyridoxal phosphate-dependent enzyme [candidate division KSB1 bacterium]